ncbi:unnamed protein product [Polarella glacialis]|uniref:Uncharacterized protein n=1 Tax=Polarella glacialis TaxID=89957 RepID=A0A813ER16_POLGL|nr:unnamed protein product [Polarella glacialis]
MAVSSSSSSFGCSSHEPAAKRPCNGVQRVGLPVFVCEYHDEALRCLHVAIRRRKLPFDGLTMVHLDAHPDMSASTTLPAEVVFQEPWHVYSALRSDPSGIASWILPAVYGGHLNCVWWVRPEWARQIADGDYRVQVGRAVTTSEGGSSSSSAPAASKDLPKKGLARFTPRPPTSGVTTANLQQEAGPLETIRISCSQPYFVEDGIFAPDSELKDAKPLQFLVSQMPGADERIALWEEEEDRKAGSLPKTSGSPWVLDVCLDYFACGNPFLTQVRPHIAAAFADVQDAATFRAGSVEDAARFISERDAFDAAFAEVLRQAIEAPAAEEDDAQGSEQGDGTIPEEDEAVDLDEEEEEEGPLEEAVAALGKYLPGSRREALLAALSSVLREVRESELHQLRDAGSMVTLPLHPPSESELRERLGAFEDFLTRLCAQHASKAGNGADGRPDEISVAVGGRRLLPNALASLPGAGRDGGARRARRGFDSSL